MFVIRSRHLWENENCDSDSFFLLAHPLRSSVDFVGLKGNGCEHVDAMEESSGSGGSPNASMVLLCNSLLEVFSGLLLD